VETRPGVLARFLLRQVRALEERSKALSGTIDVVKAADGREEGFSPVGRLMLHHPYGSSKPSTPGISCIGLFTRKG
jgi:hypothetical protein